MNQTKSPQSLHPVIDQTRCSLIEFPDGRVLSLHLHLVSVMGLFDRYVDPLLDQRIYRVSYDGL